MRKSVSRRSFLKTGAAFGSTIGFFTSSSRAAKRVSANDTIVVAVVGVNGRGRDHASGFSDQEGVEVGFICDVDQRVIKRGLEAVGEQQHAPTAVHDFRDLLDDKSIDAISIATPNHWHAPATILACEAGKHVYVEKPCSHTAEEGELAVQAARKFDRVVQMGNQRRSRAHCIEAIEKIRKGDIGKVILARTWFNSRRGSIGIGKSVDVPSGLDFALWQGPAPERPYKDNLLHYNWHWHWHWGNGELGNNGVHAIDVARWGLGVDYPTLVTSTGGRFRFQDDQETPDTHFASFHFGEQMITWEGLSWSPYGPGGSQFGISFHGDRGSMNLHDSGYTIYDLKNEPVETITQSGGDAEHYADFLDAIRNDRRPSSDIEDGHKSTLLCHLGNIAYRIGRPVVTDSANGRIVGDDEAQQLWGREYRAGWKPSGTRQT